MALPKALIDPQELRHSLRFRLPLYFSALALLMLVPFLWLTHGEVESALEEAARQRASLAGTQIRNLLSASVARMNTQSDSLQTDQAIVDFLRDPDPANRERIESSMADEFAQPFRRVELWSRDGQLLYARSSPGVIDSSGATIEFPAGSAPTTTGIGELRADSPLIYIDVVTRIEDNGAAGDGPPLGYVRRFGRIVSSTAGPIRRLVGNDAEIRIGQIGTDVWTNFEKLVPAPPPPSVDGGQADSEWVGEYTSLDLAPWDIWVGFPRAAIVAPASDVLSNPVQIALIFLVIGWVLSFLLSRRLTRPLSDLVRASAEIAAGDYTRRVDARGQDEIGRLARAFNVMTDRISAALGELKSSSEQTHFALASARIGVWEVEPGSGAMSCSESMSAVLGRVGERLPATRNAFLALVHEDDRDSVNRLLSGNAPADGGFLRYRVNAPDGEVRWMESKGRVMHDAAGTPASVLGVNIDVTEQTLLETQLRHAQKMDAVGQLAGGIAHDFNNLLTAIIGHGNLLLSELQENNPAREDVVEMLKAADSATDLTRQLLAFSRRQVLQPQLVDLNEAVSNTRNLLRRLIGERIELVTTLAAESPLVRVDPGQLQQVLVNLAVNAGDAMPGGGRLVIETANVDFTSVHRRGDEDIAPDMYVMVAVSDTGSGMTPETRDRLFEPFFTTKPVGKGTGLGLATVFGIVKQSGGYIYVYSELGHGSTFKVFLPAASGEDAPYAAASDDHLRAQAGETILLVEDTESVQSIARTILEGLGYQVVIASSGEEALRHFTESGVRPDLVISDVIMSGMTGPDLVAELRREYPELKVLFTSGYSRDALGRRAGFETGGQFIEKPYTPVALAQKVREALA